MRRQFQEYGGDYGGDPANYWDQPAGQPAPAPAVAPESGLKGTLGPFQGPFDLPPAAATGAGGGGGGGGGVAASSSPTAEELFRMRGAPTFEAPDFSAPTMESLQGDPGYQFRLGGGREALERSAAARGVLRTGGTLKDLLEYGQNFASQEYENAYNRALGSYDRQMAAAQAEFAPRMQAWQTGAQTDLARAMAEYDRYYGYHPSGGGGGGWPDIPPPPEPPPMYE